MISTMYVKLLISGGGFFALCTCIEIPVEKCNRNDSNFNKCLSAAVEHTLSRSDSPIKEIGLPILEPFFMPSLKIPAGSGAVFFQQNYINLTISGLSKAKCLKADLNFSSNTLFLECESPLIRFDFEYEINGKVLLLPLYGEGPGFIDLEFLNLKITFNLEEYKKKGKNHFRVTQTRVDMNPRNLRCRLENLFNGDKILGDNINQVFNDNWRDIFADVKTKYEDAFGQIFSAIFNKVLKKLSTSELFGNPI